MALSIFTTLWNLVPKHFHDPKQKPHPLSTHSPFVTPPTPGNHEQNYIVMIKIFFVNFCPITKNHVLNVKGTSNQIYEIQIHFLSKT